MSSIVVNHKTVPVFVVVHHIMCNWSFLIYALHFISLLRKSHKVNSVCEVVGKKNNLNK